MPQPAGYRAETDLADDDEIVTGEAVALDLRATSFVLRAAGAIIDFLVIVLLLIGGLVALGSLLESGVIDDAAFQAITIGMLVTLIIVVPMTVETLSRGKSLGRLAVGARIVRSDGGAIGFRHAFIRSLTGFLEIFGTVGGLAALVALFDTRSRRIGDFMAGTYSRNERVAVVVEPTFGIPPDLAEWSRTADVARMPNRLSRRVSQYLRQAGALMPAARQRVAAELAREVAVFVSPVPIAHPESLLMAVAALRRERESTALDLERERFASLEPMLTELPHGFPDRG